MNDSILIVEDEKNLGETLEEYLVGIGHDCHLADSCKEAKHLFDRYNPCVVLMDIELSDGSGLDLAREFKKMREDFVLLFLSVQNNPDIKVEGLEVGAEDYITKPFNLRELTLRLDRISKAHSYDSPRIVEHGSLRIWFDRFEIHGANGKVHSLSRKEQGILKLLYLNKSKVMDRDTIIENIWGEGQYPSNRTVDNYIVRLRRICESSGGIKIHSIRGIGYKLTIDQEAYGTF